MHYIKDIFNKNVTDHAHNKFIRYSNGNFVGPLLKVRISKQNIKIGSSIHYADELLQIIANKTGDELIHIKGTLIWNTDLTSSLLDLGIKYAKVSKSRGIFKYTLDNEVNLKEFLDAMGSYHILISFKIGDLSYTTKKAAPKPNKEFGPNFCKVTLMPEYLDEILEEFAFDVDKKLKIKAIDIRHQIEVSDIEIPQMDDFSVARKLAKRIGKLDRFVQINGGEEIPTSIDFKV